VDQNFSVSFHEDGNSDCVSSDIIKWVVCRHLCTVSMLKGIPITDFAMHIHAIHLYTTLLCTTNEKMDPPFTCLNLFLPIKSKRGNVRQDRCIDATTQATSS
jgi:hypothetical protein